MDKKNIFIILVLAALLTGAWFLFANNSDSKSGSADQNNMTDKNALPQEYANKQAVVQTNYGSFTIQFYDNSEPKAVENFIRLAQDNKYENTPFHRIMKGFMVQTGDYTNGDGTGGESAFGEAFAGTFDRSTEAYQAGYVRGTVAMANWGCEMPKSNGSQFFIMHADLALDTCYPIFGKVTEGMDVIDKIANVPVLDNGRGEVSVPTEKVVIEKVTIQERN